MQLQLIMLLTITGSLQLLKALAGSYQMLPKLSHLQAEPAAIPQEEVQPWLSWLHPLISLQFNIFLELRWGAKLSTVFQLWSNKCQVKGSNHFH